MVPIEFHSQTNEMKRLGTETEKTNVCVTLTKQVQKPQEKQKFTSSFQHLFFFLVNKKQNQHKYIQTEGWRVAERTCQHLPSSTNLNCLEKILFGSIRCVSLKFHQCHKWKQNKMPKGHFSHPPQGATTAFSQSTPLPATLPKCTPTMMRWFRQISSLGGWTSQWRIFLYLLDNIKVTGDFLRSIRFQLLLQIVFKMSKSIVISIQNDLRLNNFKR